MTLTFDRDRLAFRLEGCTFTLGDPLDEIRRCWPGLRVRNFPDLGWDFADLVADGLAVGMHFADGRLRSMSLVALMAGESTSWADFDEGERRRREIHLGLLRSWVGAERLQTSTAVLEGKRDIKSGEEMISFGVAPAPAG